MPTVEVRERCPGSEMNADHRLKEADWPAAIRKRKTPPKYGVAACLGCKKGLALDAYGRYPFHMRPQKVEVQR
jgi:hypothetical protein